ncbi:MAG TPA: ABC transporter substrate-binding protein [Bellilinea sp.]
MKKSLYYVMTVLFILSMLVTACAPKAAETPTAEAPAVGEPTAAAPAKAENPGLQMEQAAVAAQFFTDEAYEESLALMENKPLNPEAPVYLQYLIDDPTDISKYSQYTKKEGPYNLCFSNAGVNNPWRVVGYTDMGEQVLELQEAGEINNFYHFDANGSDEKQIADIEDLINTPDKCDLLIVSPNTSEALTPVVEKACEVLPVVVFDRGVLTDCPVIFEKTIGGYAFGISGAQFIVDNLPEGGNVLAFRILPGVDVLEQRWGAARKIFEQNPQLNVIGVEFVAYDSFKANTVVTDYLAKYGQIDAVWMDAGGTAVTILEAFEDAGADYPKVMVGEDQNDYLNFWKEKGLTAIAPTFPTYQWRTAILASLMFLKGETVQHRWVLPQVDVTQANLEQFAQPNMPPLHYTMCGCEDMKNYPDAWINVDVSKYDKLYK